METSWDVDSRRSKTQRIREMGFKRPVCLKGFNENREKCYYRTEIRIQNVCTELDVGVMLMMARGTSVSRGSCHLVGETAWRNLQTFLPG